MGIRYKRGTRSTVKRRKRMNQNLSYSNGEALQEVEIITSWRNITGEKRRIKLRQRKFFVCMKSRNKLQAINLTYKHTWIFIN